MGKLAKFLIGTCIVLVAGMVICGVAYAAIAKKGLEAGNKNLVSTEFDIDEEFACININTTTNDIQFERSGDNKCHVVCLDYEEVTHDAYVEGDTLMITTHEENHIEFSLFTVMNNAPKITVSLPESVYEDLVIDVTTGDVNFDDAFTFTRIDIEATTGDIDLNNIVCSNTINLDILTGDIDIVDVECGELVYNGTTGDIDFVNVVSTGDITIDITTGDINFDMCDAANIYIECTTGDINLVLLSDKDFDVDVTTGDADYPHSGEGGICRVTSTTGDINIEVA